MSTSAWPHSPNDFISLNYPLYFLVMGLAVLEAAEDQSRSEWERAAAVCFINSLGRRVEPTTALRCMPQAKGRDFIPTLDKEGGTEAAPRALVIPWKGKGTRVMCSPGAVSSHCL